MSSADSSFVKGRRETVTTTTVARIYESNSQLSSFPVIDLCEGKGYYYYYYALALGLRRLLKSEGFSQYRRAPSNWWVAEVISFCIWYGWGRGEFWLFGLGRTDTVAQGFVLFGTNNNNNSRRQHRQTTAAIAGLALASSTSVPTLSLPFAMSIANNHSLLLHCC